MSPARSFNKLESKLMSDSSKLALLRSARILPRRFFADNSPFLKFAPRRNFNSKIDKQLENLISRLPNGNIGLFFVGLNTFFYMVYLFWPRDKLHKYLNHFTVSKYNLSKGRFHTLIFSHFAHMGFLSYALDSLIIYLFCHNLMMMFGPVYIAKLAMLSVVLGSAMLTLQHSGSGMQRPF